MWSQARLLLLKVRTRKNLLLQYALLIALLPVLVILSLPLYLARVKFLRITAPGRIGHLAIEPDTFVKEQILGLTKRCRGVIVSPPGTAANDCLLDYWRRYIRIVRPPFLGTVLARADVIPYIRYDVRQVAIDETAPYVTVLRAWNGRPALLTLNDRHRREGWARVAELGVPRDAELICFHCREGGYSPSDEDHHSFRNCSVENYLPAVSELTRRGFWCIRMGDPSMRRIQPMDRVIDYAHSDARSDWMDIFLCATCRFFLGSASGLIYLASVFGKPTGSANHAPLSTVTAFYGNDIAIPKLVWSEGEERYLTFSEVLGSDAGNFRYTSLYQAHHLKPVENTAEDIRELTLEMLDRSENRAVYTPEDEELQLRFKALLRPGHYGYGGINRIGAAFLRRHRHLLV